MKTYLFIIICLLSFGLFPVSANAAPAYVFTQGGIRGQDDTAIYLASPEFSDPSVWHIRWSISCTGSEQGTLKIYVSDTKQQNFSTKKQYYRAIVRSGHYTYSTETLNYYGSGFSQIWYTGSNSNCTYSWKAYYFY